ncbi:MAG TPA: LPS assembly lipoprotein LptE [Steroidobacteraceae bacterium]|nr:LPS assembly lipoprotein LptE [Steroidobacteraceae bacterium]HRX88409.1 LPS assembly lipoprotein LptE [Steroidobacteraceae bacterium]
MSLFDGLRLLWVLLCIGALSACGFQLQGRQPLPSFLTEVAVEASDMQTDFVQSLRKSLVSSGATLLPDGGAARAVVEITVDEFDERVLSVSGRNVPREYELSYRVRYTVRIGDEVRVNDEELRLTRDLSFDETQILAKDREQEILREALARDLAAQVLRRLAAL